MSHKIQLAHGKVQKTGEIIMEKCNFISILFRINAIICSKIAMEIKHASAKNFTKNRRFLQKQAA